MNYLNTSRNGALTNVHLHTSGHVVLVIGHKENFLSFSVLFRYPFILVHYNWLVLLAALSLGGYSHRLDGLYKAK